MAGLLLLAAVAACTPKTSTAPFQIVAGSENQSLEPILAEFCAAHSVTCKFSYAGSLDIALGLKDPASTADAVWPAASLWIDIYDTARKVKSLKSVAQMPVILGVRRSKAEALGWVGKTVATSDILAAVKAGKLKFLMTSATQSNSGASAYLAMLASALGQSEPLTLADLDKDSVRAPVKALLAGVERSSASSRWLAELYRKSGDSGRRSRRCASMSLAACRASAPSAKRQATCCRRVCCRALSPCCQCRKPP